VLLYVKFPQIGIHNNQ